MKTIGVRLSRVEDRRLVLGEGSFVADVNVPGALHAVFLRSLYAHASIRSIDTAAARCLPGVVLVRTGAELRDKARPLIAECSSVPGGASVSHRPLAVEKVRMVGDPVAVVVAKDRYIAEDAAELIEIDYETLPAVVDAEAAARGEGPPLYDELGGNVAFRYQYNVGDIDTAFAESAFIVGGKFRQQRYSPVPLEGRGTVAHWSPSDDKLTVWMSTQWPHPVRTLIAEILNIPEEKIHVLVNDVGGAFGQKKISREDFAVILCSRELGLPVKWIEDRVENLTAGGQAKQDIVDLQAAVSQDGIILGLKASVLNDMGAYAMFPYPLDTWAEVAKRALPGPYKFSHFSFEFRGVFTNKGFQCPYRAPVKGSVTFARERLLDMVAQRIGLDPLELRKRNAIRKEDQPYKSVNGQLLQEITPLECLESMEAKVEYRQMRKRQAEWRSHGRRVGIGIGCYTEHGPQFRIRRRTSTGGTQEIGSYEAARLEVGPSGKVRAYVGVLAHGQGHHTTLAQVLAQELELPFEQIKIIEGDTDSVPYGMGTNASRSAVMGGGAVIQAARELREKIVLLASRITRRETSELQLRNGVVESASGDGAVALSLKEIAARAADRSAEDILPGGLQATSKYALTTPIVSNGVHFVFGEIDPESGVFLIKRYVVVEDCGRVINPAIVEGQTYGGIAQGIGGVFLENMVYDDNGQPLSTTFMNYLLPTAADIPEVEMHHMENPTPDTLGGFKPAGEGGVMGSVAAVTNAVADALSPLGVEVTELPLDPCRLLQRLKGIH
jgi:carbon-monoxide dehydrogenase large subunit